MADNLPVRKIYIDSRFKAATSESHSDFHYDLPQSISLPDNVICYVDNIVIPNSWKTIDANNNKLYARLTVYPSGGGGAPVKTSRIITLTENIYNAQTLRTELATQLSAAFAPTSVAITYDQVLLKYTIEPGGTGNTTRWLKLYTDSELQGSNDFNLTYDAKNLQSANELLTNFTPQEALKFETGIINLMRYRNLYLTCPTLSNYTTISPSGNSNVIKKIPVTADYGG